MNFQDFFTDRTGSGKNRRLPLPETAHKTGYSHKIQIFQRISMKHFEKLNWAVFGQPS